MQAIYAAELFARSNFDSLSFQSRHTPRQTQTQQKPNIEFEHIVRFDDARIFTPWDDERNFNVER